MATFSGSKHVVEGVSVLGTLACFAFMWLGLTSLGLAQHDVAETAPPLATLHESSSTDARALLEEAVAFYEQDDLERARSLFEQVHALAPTARTLRSLALVAYRQGRCADAIPLLEESLASEVKPLTADMRGDLESLLQQCRELVAGTTSTNPTILPKSVVEATPIEETISGTRSSAASTDAPLQRRRSRRLKRTGYGLLAGAGVAVGVSVGAYVIGRNRLQGIEDACRSNPDGFCSVAEANAREHAARLDLLSVVSIASGALAGALALTSGTLLVLHYRSSASGGLHAGVSARVCF